MNNYIIETKNLTKEYNGHTVVDLHIKSRGNFKPWLDL